MLKVNIYLGKDSSGLTSQLWSNNEKNSTQYQCNGDSWGRHVQSSRLQSLFPNDCKKNLCPLEISILELMAIYKCFPFGRQPLRPLVKKLCPSKWIREKHRLLSRELISLVAISGLDRLYLLPQEMRHIQVVSEGLQLFFWRIYFFFRRQVLSPHWKPKLFNALSKHAVNSVYNCITIKQNSF